MSFALPGKFFEHDGEFRRGLARKRLEPLIPNALDETVGKIAIREDGHMSPHRAVRPLEL
jgi:hypothetical protein